MIVKRKERREEQGKEEELVDGRKRKRIDNYLY